MVTLWFTSIMEIRGANPYVLVSRELAEKLKANWRKPMPVPVRVNGQPKEPWQVNMLPVGDGGFYLYLHGDVRRASGAKVGDAVTVEIEFDEAYKNGPQHPMPPAFAEALKQNSNAQASWDALPPSRQKEILRYLAGLKSTEAKERNYKTTLKALSGTPVHFMGRDWHDGS
jgi:Bacteriocin-protection, YdeI or OmpD-Associated/Domain of unknown function (DUF1905)